MSFIKLQQEGPRGQVDLVELALDQLGADPELRAEFAAADEVLYDPRWSAPQVSEAFRGLGYAEVTARRVNEHRRKARERRVL